MPYSLVLHCVSTHGSLRATDLQGQKGLAMFLEQLIQHQNPIVAAQLHDSQKAKPFTTVLLPQALESRQQQEHVPTARRERGGHAEAPETVKIRLTLLDDTLYPLVSQFFLEHLTSQPRLRLGQATLLVSRLLVTSASGEPWAGCARFPELLTSASEHVTSWTIHFATPTAFKSSEAELPLPIPRLCFQSWLHSWDEHAPVPFFHEKADRKAFLLEVVEGNVSVSYSQLRLQRPTFYFDGTQTREQGFVGTCRFSVRPSRVTPHDRKILDALAHYSFYAGTGRKTTMGMGMTRRVEKEKTT